MFLSFSSYGKSSVAFSHTIVRHKTNTINHDININQLRNTHRAAHHKRLSAPCRCISTTHPQNPGEDPIMTQAMTVPQQIQSTKDTYSRQMAPPPGKPLFYGTIEHDVAGSSGVTIYPQRHFTEANLKEYYLLYSLFDHHTW